MRRTIRLLFLRSERERHGVAGSCCDREITLKIIVVDYQCLLLSSYPNRLYVVHENTTFLAREMINGIRSSSSAPRSFVRPPRPNDLRKMEAARRLFGSS